MEAGVIFIEDVFKDDIFMSFEQVMAKYNLPRRDFWKYLQLRSCIMSLQRKYPLIPLTGIQELFQSNQTAKGRTSRFYSLIVAGGAGSYWREIVGSWYTISREVQTRLIT